MTRFFTFGLLALVAVTHVHSKYCSDSELPGRNLSATLQCRAKESTFQAACETDNPAERCTDLKCACYRGDIPSTISIGQALDGTWCGDNKMCYHGECIACEGPQSVPEDMHKYDEVCE